MTKSQFIAQLAEDAKLTKKEASAFLDAFVGTVTKTLASGGEVSIVGFGKFSVRERAARKGRNPQTGKTIEIEARKSPGFKAGKLLKEAVNEK